jgi:tRNA pseudouridine55 synthase
LETASQQALAAVDEAQIQQEIHKLTGVIQQRPSSVSAIKVDGKRAYDLVRSGEEVELKSREVTVSTFALVSSSRSPEGFIDLEVKVDCSSGTYIRALARDLGQALGVGGHITKLRRTRVGSFDVAKASQITDLENLALTSLAQAASDLFPTINLSDEQVTDLVHGKRLSDVGEQTGLLAGLSGSGDLVAVLEPVGSGLKSVVVFQGEQK